MTGALAMLLGSSGVARFQMAVGFATDGYKGATWNYYGFGTLSPTIAMGGLITPADLRGQTIQAIYSISDNISTSWPVGLQFAGDAPQGFVSAMTMGGVKYSFDGYGQDYASTRSVTIAIATATFTVSSTTGITAGTPVKITTSGALPTGLVAGTRYYARDVTATTFKLAATSGGAAITLSGTQSGSHSVWFDLYSRFTVNTATSSNKTGGRVPFTPTISIASPAAVTATGHGLTNGKRVLFQTTGALPSGLVANTIYYVVSAATNSFQLAATSGGTAIVTSGTQSGTHTCFEVVDVTLE
jgi:uncharacterized protein YodC (DUF2158 family)